MWQQLAIWVITTAISYALAPKPPEPSPISLDDIKMPNTDADKSWSVVFGTVTDESPHVGWYGDLRTVPIKSSGGKK